MFMLNDEDSLVNTPTCGQPAGTYPNIPEPTRLNANAIFAVNTMTQFSASQKRWQFENSCSQSHYSGPNGQTSLGGMDDVSLRYWLVGVVWLVYDPAFTFMRENLIGSSNNAAAGADVYGEEQLVPLNPVESATTYATPNPGHTANGGCPTSGSIVFSNGEGGGLGTLGAAGSCGPTNENNALFQFAPVAARQFQTCYLRGVLIGPCATVVNFRFTSNTCDSPTYTCSNVWIDTSTGWTNTFGSGGALVSYQHILNLNDASDIGPCGSVSLAVGGPGVSLCADDIYEPGGGSAGSQKCFASSGPLATFNGTCLDVTDYSQQEVALSGAPSQSHTCFQGIGVSTANHGGGPGSLTVCEAEAVLLFQ